MLLHISSVAEHLSGTFGHSLKEKLVIGESFHYNIAEHESRALLAPCHVHVK